MAQNYATNSCIILQLKVAIKLSTQPVLSCATTIKLSELPYEILPNAFLTYT